MAATADGWGRQLPRRGLLPAAAGPLPGPETGGSALYLFDTFFYGIVIFFPRAVFTSTPLAQLPLAFVVAMHY